ncbi:MAG: class I SAM-dependent methyltransferase [Actinomycetota bacterium]
MLDHVPAVVGVEPDDAMADVARERFGLDARTGFFTDDSVEEASFDLAYSCHVWEHLADPLATSEAARRALATGGHLMIVVPTFRRPRTKASACFTAPHTYMFTEVSLGNLLRQAGFEILEHRFHGGADSELWLLARAVESTDAGATVVDGEDVDHVQRELRLAPLGAPLGVPGRLRTHVETLRRDPRDFAGRTGRWLTSRLGLTPR